MTRRWTRLLAWLSVLALVAAACGAPGADEPEDTATETPATEAETTDTTEATDDPADDTAAGEEPADTTAPAGGGEGEPLRVGVILPLTGNIASSGEDGRAGWELYWENNPIEIGGRTVEFQVEDTAGDPDTALQKVDQLVGSYGAEFIVGPILANVGLAVADRLKDDPNVIFVAPISSADDLTQRTLYPNFIRAGGWTSSQTSHVLGDYAAENGYGNVATLCTDYAFGHEMCGGFVQVFTEAGGTVDPANQLWNPLGTQDFATYVTQLQGIAPEAVFAIQVGGSVGDFLNAWSDFGMKDQIPILGGEVLLDQSTIRALDPTVVDGIISSGHWAEGLETPEAQEFVEIYDEATGNLPSYYSAAMWTAAQYVAATLEEMEGDLTDKEATIEVMKGLELQTPMGPSTLDEYGNPIYDIYIRQIEIRDDGRAWNTVIETYEDIDQFWPKEAEEYLEQPVYSREFQGNAAG